MSPRTRFPGPAEGFSVHGGPRREEERGNSLRSAAPFPGIITEAASAAQIRPAEDLFLAPSPWCCVCDQSAKSSKEGREQRGGRIPLHGQTWGEEHQGLGLFHLSAIQGKTPMAPGFEAKSEDSECW
ncbi:hypothetical protein MJG53_018689 [Ovis ammon polii x Ovis aries]|uniref:Uncharacterized protein n=1 Tax=Ovis ammon polii x Ovis aries TaxID=2918886 RepID=A0ACB9U4S7_9CETA|nr:hypothetical protein MJG53_018689 [Ovis ammon polii x Ovis aries]